MHSRYCRSRTETFLKFYIAAGRTRTKQPILRQVPQTFTNRVFAGPFVQMHPVRTLTVCGMPC